MIIIRENIIIIIKINVINNAHDEIRMKSVLKSGLASLEYRFASVRILYVLE